jgi:hypothetical protein
MNTSPGSSRFRWSGVSEGGFEPPLGVTRTRPSTYGVHGAGCRPASVSVLTCMDAGDLVGIVTPGATVCTTAWGNAGGMDWCYCGSPPGLERPIELPPSVPGLLVRRNLRLGPRRQLIDRTGEGHPPSTREDEVRTLGRGGLVPAVRISGQARGQLGVVVALPRPVEQRLAAGGPRRRLPPPGTRFRAELHAISGGWRANS